MLKGLRDFLMRGNVVDLAVAVIVGAAFNQVVNSLVADVLTPILGALGGIPDFSALKIGPVAIGRFIN
jgi:large conductance mechanosensitive channel